jgi:hypothetical protein
VLGSSSALNGLLYACVNPGWADDEVPPNLKKWKTIRVVSIVLIKRFLQGITGLRSITKQKSNHHGCGTQ